jgi:hypothetical protein
VFSNVTSGQSDVVAGAFAGISSGLLNEVTTDFGFIGSGRLNKINSVYSFIGSGDGNVISGGYSAISGGEGNTVTNLDSYIGGGYQNQVLNEGSAVVGGYNNTINGYGSFIGGGYLNTDNGLTYNTIGGGEQNQITDIPETGNVQPNWGTIGGGVTNRVYSDKGSICGGDSNEITGTSGAICGGQNNKASFQSFVGGGAANFAIGKTTNGITASGDGVATISGGIENVIGNSSGGDYSVISGGRQNTIYGDFSAIIGGDQNSCSGSRSSILGGSNNVVSGNYSLGAGTNVSATHNNTAVFGLSGAAVSTSYDNTFVVDCGSTGSNYGMYYLNAPSGAGSPLQILANGRIVVGTPPPLNAISANMENIKDAVIPSGTVDKLQPISYNVNGSKTVNLGFKLENVRQHFPQGVSMNQDGKADGLNDRALITMLVKEVQHLRRRVEMLEKK